MWVMLSLAGTRGYGIEEFVYEYVVVSSGAAQKLKVFQAPGVKTVVSVCCLHGYNWQYRYFRTWQGVFPPQRRGWLG